ncbi:MAG: hypothetical protein K9K38_07615 [Rhodoferax sp.]|nr:hypothetical protein [Rhodoferax sp.]
MKNFHCLALQIRAKILTGLGRPPKYGATVTRTLHRDSGFFYVPSCMGSMVSFTAGRVGTPQGVPVPYSGRPTLHGLPPSLGREGGRFNTCQYGVTMTTTTTLGKSARTTPTGRKAHAPQLSEAALYAQAKQVPDLARRGCTICTAYGEITIPPGRMTTRLAEFLHREISRGGLQ